ncbi:unnamed protein product, partial [Amoebophrya sp. A25]
CWRHTLVFPTKNLMASGGPAEQQNPNLVQGMGGAPSTSSASQLIHNPVIPGASSLLPGSSASILSWNQ